MDCEKLDAMAMDLVDPDGADELDALRAQQAEEHLAGCARCTALVARLRRGLGAARELELEDAPSLLESRILAAAAIAKPRPSWPRRASRVVSTAGAWAMRPQVAMAAVLVVMLGMSAILLRGGLPSRRTKVTDEGTPVATLEPASPEGAGAPAVIGAGEPVHGKPDEKAESKAKAKEAPHPAPASPKAEAAPADLLAKPAEEKEHDKADKADNAPLKKLAEKAKGGYGDEDFGGLANDGKAGANNYPGATKPPSAPAQGPMPAPTTAAPPPPAKAPAGGATEDANKDLSKQQTAAGTTTNGSFDDAMTAYKEKRWGAAAQGFDAAAAAGNKPSTSTLYAARSYRAAGSCAQAMPRFQKVVSTWPSSADAPYAALEGGQCAKALGDVPTARALFLKAKSYPATQKSAEAELAALDKPPINAPKATMKPATSDSY